MEHADGWSPTMFEHRNLDGTSTLNIPSLSDSNDVIARAPHKHGRTTRTGLLRHNSETQTFQTTLTAQPLVVLASQHTRRLERMELVRKYAVGCAGVDGCRHIGGDTARQNDRSKRMPIQSGPIIGAR